MRYIDSLQPILRHILAQLDSIPPEESITFDPPRNAIFLASASDVPLQIRPCLSAEDFLAMTGESLAECPSFVNDRFRAIINQHEMNLDVQLVGCAWKIGDVWISALGAFDLRGAWKAEDGLNRYPVLNGHVNVCVSPSQILNSRLIGQYQQERKWRWKIKSAHLGDETEGQGKLT
ncbi:hypothetical protein NMY22_g9205 [Coprinellus aureogranulatus]|nr:hypothetical protein NMY22_g9205 [Coprinellus aureogranulatus]